MRNLALSPPAPHEPDRCHLLTRVLHVRGGKWREGPNEPYTGLGNTWLAPHRISTSHARTAENWAVGNCGISMSSAL
eukprot:4436194-Pleurochrysis_carterae.AAC.2